MERRQHFPENHSVFINPDGGVTFSMPPSQGGYHAPGVQRMEADPVTPVAEGVPTDSGGPAVHEAPASDTGAPAEATATPDASGPEAAERDNQEPRGRRVRRFLGSLAMRARIRLAGIGRRERGRHTETSEESTEAEGPDFEALQRTLDAATGDLAMRRAQREVHGDIPLSETHAEQEREQDEQAQESYNEALGNMFAAHQTLLPETVTASERSFAQWKDGFLAGAEQTLRRTVNDTALGMIHEDLLSLNETLERTRSAAASTTVPRHKGTWSEEDFKNQAFAVEAYDTARERYRHLLQMADAYRGISAPEAHETERAWLAGEEGRLQKAMGDATHQAGIQQRIKHGARPSERVYTA